MSSFFFFLVLGFGLRTYTLSHSTSPIFVMLFFPRESLTNYFARSPDLCLLSSQGYRHEPLAPGRPLTTLSPAYPTLLSGYRAHLPLVYWS
jgi:hypothetical protein